MKAILPIILLTVVLISCGGTGVAPNVPEAQPPQQPIAEPSAPEQPQRTQSAASYTAKLQELLDKTQKVKSYTFYYIDSTTQLQADQWFVKGDRAAVKLYEPNYWDREEWVDTVYLDFARRTAVGYCENWQKVRCTDNNRMFTIALAPFDKKLPTYWLSQIPAEAQVMGSETIDERFVTKIQWTEGGKTYTMWMDNTFGIPIKVLIEGGREPEEFYYKDMAFNAVKEEMLVHQYVKRG